MKLFDWELQEKQTGSKIADINIDQYREAKKYLKLNYLLSIIYKTNFQLSTTGL